MYQLETNIDEVINTNQVLVRHIRDNNSVGGGFKGTMVASVLPDKQGFSVGLSVCCSADHFDKKFGTNLAYLRTQFNYGKNKKRTFHVHPEIVGEVQDFITHTKRYFKDKEYVHTLDIEEPYVEAMA